MSYQFSKKQNSIPNYISHNEPSLNPSFNKWYKHYEKELDDLYCIFIDNLKIYFPEKDPINDKYFNHFCKMVYNSSSKNLN